MAEADSGNILEGFLCPICKADLQTALQLHAHFHEEHNEDQDDVLKTLKGFLGKAKKKIFKLDEDLFSSDYDQPQITKLGSSPATHFIEIQDIGATRDFSNYFRSIRNIRLERYAAETNKLLIRLDKLLNDMPVDALKRKAHEQAIVPWIDDRDVKLCPNCAKSFHLARRKHHCRLCGAIMCHNCTHFLSLTAARKMTNPGFGHDASSSSPSVTSKISLQAPSTNSLLLKRSGSNTSLNSVLSLVDSVAGEPQLLRLCVHCQQLLDTRERLKEERNVKPIISQFYERLKAYQTEADELASMYSKMWQSLSVGEPTYKLMDAQILRVKLLKLAESIDALSKKIAILGTKDVDPPQGNTLQLQLKIRIAATYYLRDQLVTLPNLPTEQQLAAIIDRRRQEVSARILQEKQLALEAQQRNTLVTEKAVRASPQRVNNVDQVVVDSGWGPESTQTFEYDDPMIQQMNIIRNYIKQARMAHKYDEVSTLENNLKELQIEYYKQQQSE